MFKWQTTQHNHKEKRWAKSREDSHSPLKVLSHWSLSGYLSFSAVSWDTMPVKCALLESFTEPEPEVFTGSVLKLRGPPASVSWMLGLNVCSRLIFIIFRLYVGVNWLCVCVDICIWVQVPDEARGLPRVLGPEVRSCRGAVSDLSVQHSLWDWLSEDKHDQQEEDVSENALELLVYLAALHWCCWCVLEQAHLVMWCCVVRRNPLVCPGHPASLAPK